MRISTLLLAGAAAALMLAASVQSTSSSQLLLSFTKMDDGRSFNDPIDVAFANHGTAYIADWGTSTIVFTPANSTTASIFFDDCNVWPRYVAANPSAQEPNQLFFIDTSNQLYRLNTSSSDPTARTQISIDTPQKWGILLWITFTFVNNTIFAVVRLDGAGPERSALMLLTFGSDVDEYPVSQFLPLQQPANSTGLQVGLGNLVPTAEGDLYVTNRQQFSDDAVYKLASSDIHAARISSKPGQWGTNLTVTPVLSGALWKGGQPIRVQDVLPLQINGREQLLMTDVSNAVVMLWDPSVPLDPLHNPLPFPLPADTFPLYLSRR